MIEIKIINLIFFTFDGLMTDTVQAKKDLEFCSAELSKYQNLRAFWFDSGWDAGDRWHHD